MKVLQLLFVTLLTNAFMVAANNGGDDDCAAAEEQCIRDCQAKGIKGIPKENSCGNLNGEGPITTTCKCR
ncbi:hypothetical protein MCOR07_000547 [Pyricularia oryzae]|nr:hypothetical protein MCOR01_005566 [Pyricularia oryzae]KAI6327655.1 hypothetical protein MCOR29_002958 [Pyricularia oryzae]KAI6497248.1 hypothetical protein MCOR11_004610 [Pyricularia oryzae]KAI6537119.1 hypothetical protein MCOR16_002165 [Pyricularia oryzae]KAI6577364.1 hypothetical protein MCOR09_000545 [Pyricularia oryzae]